MLTRDFWKAVTERLVKTLIQAVGGFALAVLTVVLASPTPDAFAVNWRLAFGTGLYAALLSLLTSLGSARFGPSRGPSLVGETLVSEGRHVRRGPEGEAL